MQILKISLYGQNGERRDVDFALSQVNIITGASKKGKSSLLDIVEYCLGSSEYDVAEGEKFLTVAWFSVLLQFSDTQVFIARATPLRGQKSNSSCHLIVANEIQVPDRPQIENSTNIKSVVDFLTSKLGIPEQITEVPQDQTRASIRIGFKHSRYYLFQGQDEVAAKRTLFHRQAEPHIPQAIRDTLPYFMGAAEDDRLSQLHELRNLKRDRTRLAKQISEIQGIRGEGLRVGFELLAEAADVGLHKGELTLSDDDLLSALKRVVRWAPASLDADEFDDDVWHNLEKRYRELSNKKRVVRSRLRAANDYGNSLEGFAGEVKEQELRLQSIDLYKRFSSSSSCPICDAEHDESKKAENIIRASIEQLSLKLDGLSRNRPRVESYLQSLDEENRRLASEIRKTRDGMDALRDQEDRIATKAELDDKRSRVAGRVSLYLQSTDLSDDTSRLQHELDQINPQIEELEEKLDPAALKERLEAQLSCVSEDMTRWARDLNLEHSEYPIRLDVSKLTIAAETPHGRTPLHKMGSGENWVGYHLVAYLALAKWFIEQDRPVGRFIFFDQPSQVYFPSDQSITGKLEEIGKDEDRQAVKKMFKWIFKIVAELSPNLQVIITDHADIDEDWFQSAIRDTKWRGDAALIPRHWYE